MLVLEAKSGTATYSPYGEVLVQDGLSGTEYGFSGEQEDEAVGLLYLRARYYDHYFAMLHCSLRSPGLIRLAG